MAKAKWQIEAEKREAAEKELKALKERIPSVLAECVSEYGLEDTLCVDGLQDFCSRLGAADYKAHVKGSIVIAVENIDLPGEPNGHYAIDIHDETLQEDLDRAVTKVLAERLPKASWDNMTITFER